MYSVKQISKNNKMQMRRSLITDKIGTEVTNVRYGDRFSRVLPDRRLIRIQLILDDPTMLNSGI